MNQPYVTERITGGVAIYRGRVTRLANALRIVATEGDAAEWIARKAR